MSPLYLWDCPYCKQSREIVESIAEYSKRKCPPDCKCGTKMVRNYESNGDRFVSFRTLGHYADVRGDRISSDEIESIERKRMDPTANKLLKSNDQ